MKTKPSLPLIIVILVLISSCKSPYAEQPLHVGEIKEIVLHSTQQYDNPYTDVECWVELQGPGFHKKIFGYWNGGNEFVFRVAATAPGTWSWTSFSNQTDRGLNGQKGVFKATEWSPDEINKNPNRRGYIRATENGHALEYADGTPYFMLGDTWWAASTWRYPLTGNPPDQGFVPGEGISFENALEFRKQQGYNTIAMIAAFPNWKVDEHPPQYYDKDSVGLRQAWEKNGMNTAKDMHDEAGNMPFEAWEKSDVIANFDRINPEYFKSLDKKLYYLDGKGFVTFLETVRRDHGPSWKAHFDWQESYTRYVQYIIARYGAFNIIFSGIHLDWINEDFCLPPTDFNEVLTHHHTKYGFLPYGQPHTILIDGSTYRHFGHGEQAPWLTMHAVGNVPRNHGFYPMIEELYRLAPPYPAANLEPYYPGWDNPYHNTVAGERPEPDSERDHYFGRAQMYGSVLSGGLAGHMYGTGAYDGNTSGEPKAAGDRPYIWEALNYSSAAQLQFLGKFLLSEGKRYQECIPAREKLEPYKAGGAPEDGLDGWAFLLLAPEKDLGFLYFENLCEIPEIGGLLADQEYTLQWFDPLNGQWLEESQSLSTDARGALKLDHFPGGQKKSDRDWSLKIKI